MVQGYPDATEVLKDGELFFVDHPYGCPEELGTGLFYQDTRFLSGISLEVEGRTPILLSSVVHGGSRSQLDLTNPEMATAEGILPAHSLHLRVSRVLSRALFQQIQISSFAAHPLTVTLRFTFRTDFHDIFEVRGFQRRQRGHILPPEEQPGQMALRYEGLDHVVRTTRIRLFPLPDRQVVEGLQAEAEFRVRLPPRQKTFLYLQIQPELGEGGQRPVQVRQGYRLAIQRLGRQEEQWLRQCTGIETDNSRFNTMVRQATTDMRALFTHYPGMGTILDAGIPWFVAPFGRDSMIAGIESLLLNPALAKESLRFLARLQGSRMDPWRDEEPGKMLHELRRGELARCGEIPHTPYYGSIDSTLWWIIALGETWRFTRDRKLLKELLDPLHRAVRWIMEYGDRDRDGLLEYERQSPAGLGNQGWKDSDDAVVDTSGRLAEPPIALVEVQAYAYYALRIAGEMFSTLGDEKAAIQASGQARRLRSRFRQAFWQKERGDLAFALDGKKRPLLTAVSNGGHALFAGILSRQEARRTADRLLESDLLSGFGIRTLGQREEGYNPMSYHRGSVWPHDNALILWGLKSIGREDAVLRVATQLYEASLHFPQGRLPELFCGFTRHSDTGPVHYPVACNPQAWAAAIPFFMLRVLLGISCSDRDIRIERPVLPPWLKYVSMDRLRIGPNVLDVEFARARGTTYANVIRNEGPFRIVVEPL